MNRFVFLIILSLLLVGCNLSSEVNKKQSTTSQVLNDSKVTMEKIDKELTKQDLVEVQITLANKTVDSTELNYRLPKNFSLSYANIINDTSLLMVLQSTHRLLVNNEMKEDRFFIKYNIEQNTQEILYKDEGLIGIASTKILKNGNLALQMSDKILLLEQHSLKVIGEIEIPNTVFEYDLSYSGSLIVFSQEVYNDNSTIKPPKWETDLFVSGVDFANPKRIVKGVMASDDDGISFKRPGKPKWSYDDQKILYILHLYEGSEGLGIVSVDGTGNILIKRSNGFFNVAQANWSLDNSSILCTEIDDHDLGLSHGRIVNLPKQEIKPMDMAQNIRKMIQNPTGKDVVIIQERKNSSPVALLDLQKQNAQLVYTDWKHYDSIKWSTTGKHLVLWDLERITLLNIGRV